MRKKKIINSSDNYSIIRFHYTVFISSLFASFELRYSTPFGYNCLKTKISAKINKRDTSISKTQKKFLVCGNAGLKVTLLCKYSRGLILTSLQRQQQRTVATCTALVPDIRWQLTVTFSYPLCMT